MLLLSQIKLALAFAAVLGYASSEKTSSSSEEASKLTARDFTNCATGQATVPPLVETDCQNALDSVPAVSAHGGNYLKVDDSSVTKKSGTCQVKIVTNNGGDIYLDKSKAYLGLHHFFVKCVNDAGNIVVPFGSAKGEGNRTASIFFDKPHK